MCRKYVAVVWISHCLYDYTSWGNLKYNFWKCGAIRFFSWFTSRFLEYVGFFWIFFGNSRIVLDLVFLLLGFFSFFLFYLNENDLGFNMRCRLFLHYRWFLQNLEKGFIQTNMHTSLCRYKCYLFLHEVPRIFLT